MDGKDIIAIVTGAGRGLGLAFTQAILRHGGRVCMTDIDGDSVDAACRKLQREYSKNHVYAMQHDVRDLASFEKVFDTAEKYFQTRVTLLVNNAGIASKTDFYDDTLPEHWIQVLEINTTSVMRGTQVALKYMKKNKNGGVVINISSASGFWPVPESPDYSTSKAAVIALTRAIGAVSVHMSNVRVVALCPSFADTDMGRSAMESIPSAVNGMGGFMPVEVVGNAMMALIHDTDNSGRALLLTNRGAQYYGDKNKKKLLPSSKL